MGPLIKSKIVLRRIIAFRAARRTPLSVDRLTIHRGLARIVRDFNLFPVNYPGFDRVRDLIVSGIFVFCVCVFLFLTADDTTRDCDCGWFACGKKPFYIWTVRFRTSWPLDVLAGRTFFLSPTRCGCAVWKKTDLFYSAPSRTRVYGRIKKHGKKNKRLRYRPADRPERSAWRRGCWRPACEHTLIILDAAPPAGIRAVLSDDRRRPFRRTVRAKRWPAPTHTRVGRSENRRIPSVPALAIGLVRASPPEPRKRAKKKKTRSSTHAIHKQTCMGPPG